MIYGEDYLYSGLDTLLLLRVVDKLRKVGAISRDRAVTAKEADLDSQETQWLGYLAGGTFSNIKRTREGRYYTNKSFTNFAYT